MRHIYTSIDIGSDTIKVIVCELCKNKLNLLGASSVNANGIKKGVISDPKAAIISIKKAINEVEEMLGIELKKVLVTVPSYFAKYKTFKEEIALDDTPISNETISKLMQQILTNNSNKAEEIATVQTTDYKVDDVEVKDPKGQIGKTLKVRGIVTTIPRENLYSVVALLEKNGINVVDVCVGPISDYYAYKSKQYDSKNGIVVNIGSELTTISVVTHGIVIKSSVIQFGGKSIDNDIAYIYKIDSKSATALKEKFAFAHSSGAKSDEVKVVKNIINEDIEINQHKISEICMARLEEILNLIKNEISSLTNIENDYIIITGGTSNMKGLGKLAIEKLDSTAVVENIKLLGVRNNKFVTPIGTIIYFISKLKTRGQEYTMIDKNEVNEMISNAKSKNIKNGNNVIDKVFNYFFNE